MDENDINVKRLVAHRLVERVTKTKTTLVVWFETGLREYWPRYGRDRVRGRGLCKAEPGEEEWWGEDIEILNENPSTLSQYFRGVEDDDNFLVQSSDLKEAAFIPKRLMVHQLIEKLVIEGWRQPHFKEDVLERDRQAVIDESIKPYIRSPGAVLMHKQWASLTPPGYAIANQYIDWGPLATESRESIASAYDQPNILWGAVNYLMVRNRDITRSSILRTVHKQMMRGWDGFRPGFFKAFLGTILGHRRPVVLDMDPGMGSKAVATSALGGTYLFPAGSQAASGALQIASLFGAEAEADDGMVTADVAFLGDIRPWSAASILDTLPEVMDRAATTCAFVRREESAEVLRAFPTKQQIRVDGEVAQKSNWLDDLILLYHQQPIPGV